MKTRSFSRLKAFLVATYRDFVFRRAMKRFLRAPLESIQPGSSVVRDLVNGWGNEYWSALDEYLVGCVQHALTADGPILECGSGLTTIVIGTIAKQRGLKHWALENVPEWATKVQRYLDEYDIDSVVICSKPLRDYGEFVWYDPPMDAMPLNFSLVLCDGPPADTRGGRFGLGSVMKDRLGPGCVILLDDAEREEERAIARRWKADLGASIEMLARSKPYIKLTVTGEHQGAPASRQNQAG